MIEKHERESNLIHSDGKVNMEAVKYDLDELFENPPIFGEPIIRFCDVIIDPDQDPNLVRINKRALRSEITAYTRALARFKEESAKSAGTKKNLWKQIRLLSQDKYLRDAMLAKADDCTSQRMIESLKRRNFPFYYIKPD